MPEAIKKTCKHCGEEVLIERNNANGILYFSFNQKYYHKDCFVELAKRRAANKRSSPLWQEALDDLSVLERAATEMANYWFAQDELNEWVLTHYDVIEIPNWFWNTVGYLRNGKYHNKKCKPVPTDLLVSAWKWAQKNLDSINRRNKKNKKGPKTDAERLNYDLAIVLQHIPDYKKAQAKRELEEAERKAMEKETIKIDYNKVQAKKADTGLGDISDLLDDLI